MANTKEFWGASSNKSERSNYALSCRYLIRRARAGILSTSLNSVEGWPYGSLVTVAFDYDLSPIMLFSTLSDHTRNLTIDNRASILIEESTRLKNPQTGLRVSVLGHIEKTLDASHAQRFLSLHPEASIYAGFGDFSFWRMKIYRAHFVGGFAKAIWFDASEVQKNLDSGIDCDSEKNILSHMNDDHADAIDHYANALLGRCGKGWKMTGVDPDGVDLRLGGRTARLEFNEPVNSLSDVRNELVRLAKSSG
ncbi:MAG: DUF2470 domain-containing protein [Pseudomonadota bacterium]|nr:DUF2470 domain-containing protein [Pseudomonadota bacterium]